MTSFIKINLIRHFILFVATATLFSCVQNDTKQKEVELKEKESALSEKDSVKAAVKSDTVKTALDQEPASQPLILTPLNISGAIGHVTFSQKGKTIFYYDAKSKRGKIILNGSEYILNKIEGDYKLTGDNVSITTTKGKWAEMESDCGYGKSLVVTIKMGAQVLNLNNVEVQDCLSMIE